MQSPSISDPETGTPAPTPKPRVITDPDFSGAATPIGDVASQVDFPQCVLGVHIDIRGFTGVVVEIVKESIKVRSPEGVIQRFNANRLKTLYARPEPPEPASAPADTPEPAPEEPAAPPRIYIANPDFSAPARPISDYADQPTFPQCTYGKHVEIPGYAGVVVEIVNGSLKIQSPEGVTRSYNGGVLKKLYGGG